MSDLTGALYDEDGYPTDEALDYLDRFEGTPAEYVAYAESLWDGGAGVRIEDADRWGRPTKKVSFVTGGWSGCETVAGHMKRTMFSFAYWQHSTRGGLTVFEVPASQWDEPIFLGKLRLLDQKTSPKTGSYPERLRTVNTAELRVIIDTMDDDHYDAARENLVLLTKRLETGTEIG